MKKIIFCILILSLLIWACSDDNPTESVQNPPTISAFTANPLKIILNSSATLSWTVSEADSVVVSPAGGSFTTVRQTSVAPTETTDYRLIAFNNAGRDTAFVTVEVATSFLLSPTNGIFYKGTMLSSSLDNPLEFTLTDVSQSNISDADIFFTILEGDGTLSTDSIRTDSNGKVTAEYNFDGELGYAVIRARFSGFDSTDVYIRADMLKPKNSGQAQFVLFNDRYQDVKNFNGEPASLDTYVAQNLVVTFANYEAELGVVVLLYDYGITGIAEDTTSVHGVIVVDSLYLQPDNSMNKRYEGTMLSGIGIGSSYRDDIVIDLQFGECDSIYLDTSDPTLPAVIITYIMDDESEVVFWCHPQDTTVYQVDLFEKFGLATPETAGKLNAEIREATKAYLKGIR